jgi:hypothetical protein
LLKFIASAIADGEVMTRGEVGFDDIMLGSGK